MFDGDLRQQEPAAFMRADEEPVATDLHFFGGDELRPRQNTEFDFEVWSVLNCNRRESVILESGGPRSFPDGAIERAVGKNITDTSAQLATKIK